MCFGIVYGDGRSVGTATSRLVGGLSGIGIRLADESWRFAAETGKRKPDGGKDWLPLVCANQTMIRRHLKIRGNANPYDSQWGSYFAARGTVKRKDESRTGEKL